MLKPNYALWKHIRQMRATGPPVGVEKQHGTVQSGRPSSAGQGTQEKP